MSKWRCAPILPLSSPVRHRLENELMLEECHKLTDFAEIPND